MKNAEDVTSSAFRTALLRGGRDSNPADSTPQNDVAQRKSLATEDSEATKEDETRRAEPKARAADEVERALSDALSNATTAGRWDVVIELARELAARRIDLQHASSAAPSHQEDA